MYAATSTLAFVARSATVMTSPQRVMRQPRPAARLRSSIEPDCDGARITRPSMTKQFAEMVGHVRCARCDAFDFTTQSLQFGHQMRQRPGGKESVRLLGRHVMQHRRGGASS